MRPTFDSMGFTPELKVEQGIPIRTENDPHRANWAGTLHQSVILGCDYCREARAAIRKAEG